MFGLGKDWIIEPFSVHHPAFSILCQERLFETRGEALKDFLSPKIENSEWKIENATFLQESESEKSMTRNQQIGVWLALTLLLALALYRWFNLP